MDLGIRLGCFVGVLLAMAIWETLAPRRGLTVSRKRRWTCNLGMCILDTLLIRLLPFLAAMGMAEVAARQDWGLLNIFILPYYFSIGVAVVALDLVIYLQHVMFHAVPLFWRFHKMHHTDLDLDVTSALRFHPFEIVLSMGIKTGAVAFLGAPPEAVLVFEILLNATSMFNHGNVRIPQILDRVLRWFVVTPDMHRVHHSVVVRESNSNFGFNLPWWDRCFGTYRPQPAAGHDGMTIGLIQHQRPEQQSFWWMLAIPFRREVGIQTIDRRFTAQ